MYRDTSYKELLKTDSSNGYLFKVKKRKYWHFDYELGFKAKLKQIPKLFKGQNITLKGFKPKSQKLYTPKNVDNLILN